MATKTPKTKETPVEADGFPQPRQVTPAEGRQVFNRAARRYMKMSGDEFICIGESSSDSLSFPSWIHTLATIASPGYDGGMPAPSHGALYARMPCARSSRRWLTSALTVPAG